MIINEETFKEFFTLPHSNIIKHLPPGSIPFNFVSHGKDTLVVTFGESWSWGYGLSYGNHEDFRLENVYGNLLAKHCSADFLNLAVPGGGNDYMQVLFHEFSILAEKLKYKKIIAIITFTEIGAEFNGWFDKDVDYRSWLAENIHDKESYTEFLRWQHNQLCFKIKNDAAKIKNLVLKIAWSASDPIGADPLKENLLDKTWLQVYSEKYPDIGTIGKECYFISAWVAEKYRNLPDIYWDLDKSLLNEWLLTRIEKGVDRISMVFDPNYFRDQHPIPIGHECWAEYIYTNLKKDIDHGNNCP